MTQFSPMSIPLTIEKIIFGGLGLGHLADGKVALVAQVLPGEKVLIQPTREKKHFLEARLLDILLPSPDRVTPPCPFFSHCGGCDFQHILSEKQPILKDLVLRELVQRQLPLKAGQSDIFMLPLSSPLFFHYRQRIRLQVADGEVGFYRFHSHKIQKVDACLLARPELNTVLAHLLANDDFVQLAELLQSIELLLSLGEGRVVILLHMMRKIRPRDKKRIERVVASSLLVKAIIVFVSGHGISGVFFGEQGNSSSLLHFPHTLPDGTVLSMKLEAGGFSQVNQEQNENLIALVLDWADIVSESRVLDLFCGMGNFSLPLARKVKQLVGMDLQRAAIRSAGQNAETNGLKNCRFMKCAAGEGARDLVKNGETFDLVLLDPPRQGCADVISFLSGLQASQVIYISCDPATLCRDLVLLEGEGYSIEKIKMVDMFPQTHHMETIVSLKMM